MTDNLLTADVQEIENDTPIAASFKKPVNLPDKFWDAKNQQIRVDALLSSYLALEKRLSNSVPVPQTPDDKKRIQKLMGVPDKAEDYVVTVPNDLFDVDPELNARLLGKGFTQEQVQEVYDLAAEKLVPLIIEMAADFQADHEIERLVAHFGGADKWNEIARQLSAFAQKNLPGDVVQGLSCSYEGIMALYRMMKADQPALKTRQDTASGSGEVDLYSMMKSPKYWRDKDPAYVAKVTAGFERLYNK